MGAWAAGPFENDGALDWLSMQVESGAPFPDYLRATLERAAGSAEYLEADEGQEALAAAAVVALRLPGGESLPLGQIPDAVDDIAFDPDRGLRELAARAVDQVLAESSELAEL